MTVSTSTPLKRSSDQPLESAECSPVNKRAKTDELQKNSLSSRLSDLKGLKITVEDGSAILKHSISNVVGTNWERNCSPAGSEEECSSSTSLEECDEQARRLKKFVKTSCKLRNKFFRSGNFVEFCYFMENFYFLAMVPGRRTLLVEGARPTIGVRGECQLMSSNNLLENLVKNKPQLLVDR